MGTEDSGRGARDPRPRRQAATLLEALERLHSELPAVADEIIRLLRAAGVTSGDEPAGDGVE